MSLINDALKRAKQAHQKNSPPPVPATMLRPVEAMRTNSSTLGILWPLALFGLVVLGAVIVWLALRPHGSHQLTKPVAQVQPAPPAVTPKLAPTVTVPPQPTTKLSVQPLPKPVATASVPKPAQSISAPVTQSAAPAAAPLAAAPAQPSTTVAAADTNPTPKPATIVASGPPASPPALPKLQGIIFRPDRPAAVLSGKTVFVGSTSGDYRVAAIDQATVTLVRAGRTNVLSMAE